MNGKQNASFTILTEPLARFTIVCGDPYLRRQCPEGRLMGSLSGAFLGKGVARLASSKP